MAKFRVVCPGIGRRPGRVMRLLRVVGLVREFLSGWNACLPSTDVRRHWPRIDVLSKCEPPRQSQRKEMALYLRRAAVRFFA